MSYVGMCREHIKDCINRNFEKKLLDLIKKFGRPISEVQEIPHQLAARKPKEGEDYYYYIGPNDQKTREFCKEMLRIDKVFSETDIDIMSNYLNYDVLKYKGSYNCRHNWIKFRGKVITTPEPTVRQIKSLVSKGIPG